MRVQSFLYGLACLVVTLCTVSCGNKSERNFAMPQALTPIRIVAVLPFENLSDDVHAGDAVTELFTTRLLRGGRFKMLEKSEVQRLLREKGIALPSTIDRFTAAKVGSALGVDGIFYGAVLEYTYLNEVRDGEVVAREPAVGLQAKLLDVNKRSIVWAAAHSRSSYKMLVSNSDSIVSVAQLAVDSMASELPK